MNSTTFLQQLTNIGQLAESQQATIKKNRHLPDDIVQQLKATGAFRLWVAKDLGGQQAHALELLEAIRTVSYYSGSLGWVLGVTGTAGLGSGYLATPQAEAIFGDAASLTGGWAAPAGRAKRLEGGLVVSGKWSWGSGIRHCTHIVGGVLIERGAGKRPISALAYFEPKDVQLMDNWEVLGLHGTNSIDYQVTEVFVPDGQWLYFPVRQAVVDAPLYRFSFLGALAAGVASVALGLAQRAIDEIILLAHNKVPNGAKRKLSERPIVHEKVALMQANFHATKAFLEQAVHKNWSEAELGQITIAAKSELRLAATFAVQQATTIVQEAYTLGGGSTVWNGVKLQELLQDIHMVSQHGMVTSSQYEIAGRVTFGMTVNEWLL